MTSAIATQPQLGAAIEACLMEGDLSKLDNAGRMHFYSAICNSLGLNPLTSPFEYIKLNGKLTPVCQERLHRPIAQPAKGFNNRI